MKKVLLIAPVILLFVFLSCTAYAQHIPDSTFANAIRVQCPTCIDANNDLTPTASTLTILDVSGLGIADLTGIGGFTNLGELNCSKNILSNLPTLPLGLSTLNCSHNSLTSLPTLPNGLITLDCSYNQLTVLPSLPSNLQILDCSYNQLTNLPILPSSLLFLDTSGNPNLTCGTNPVIVSITPKSLTQKTIPKTICLGDIIQIIVEPQCSDCIYQWSTSPTQTGSPITGNPIIFIPTITTTYSVTVTKPTSIVTPTGSITITVNNPVATITGNTSVCQGSSTTLTASIGELYLWSTGETTQNITISSAGNYCVTTSDPIGCTATACDTVLTCLGCDDFNTPARWLHPTTNYTCQSEKSQLNITGGKFHFDNANDGHFNYMYKKGGTISDAAWEADIDFEFIGMGGFVFGGGTGAVLLALNAGGLSPYYDDTQSCFGGTSNICSHPGGLPCSISNQEGIALNFSTTTPSSNDPHLSVIINTGGSFSTVLDATNTLNFGTYYLRLARTSPTTGQLSVFSDVNRTIHVTGSPYCFPIPSSIDGLNTAYIGVQEMGYYRRKLTATLDNICVSNKTPLNITPIAITGDTAICDLECTTLTASGGLSYTWSNGETTESIEVCTAGTYTVTATTAQGCTAIASITVTTIPKTVTTTTQYVTICQGNSTVLHPVSGIQLITNYNWSNGATTPSLTVSSGGTYTLTVEPLLGCEISVINYEVVLSTVQASISGNTSICQDSSTTLTASGGGIYSWSNGANTESINVSIPGEYCVTVSNVDSNLIYNGDFSLGNVGFNTNYPYSSFPLACSYAVTNGYYSITSLLDHTSNSDNMMLSLDGCTSPTDMWQNSSPIIITPNTNYRFSFWMTRAAVTQPQIDVKFNGVHQSTFVGPAVPNIPAPFIWDEYSLIWNSGANTTLTIDMDNIELSMNDGNDFAIDDISLQKIGCTASACITISDSLCCPPLNISINSNHSNNEFCAGEQLCMTTVINGVTNPTTGYTYQWYNATGGGWSPVSVANGGTTPNPCKVLNTSGYFELALVVTGTSESCKDTVWIPILVHYTPDITLGQDTTVCAGACVTFFSNKFDLQDCAITWSGGSTPNSWTNTICGAGTYTASVTCDSVCSDIDTIVITELPPPVITITGNNVICGSSNTILTANGGVSYLWSNGLSTKNITVGAGTYCVTATDANGCTGTACITVTSYPGLTLSETHINTCCYGQEKGNIDWTVSGGTVPYTWSNGPSLWSLGVGTFCTTVTDANGCSATSCVTLTQPTQVVASETHTNPTCFGTCNGAVNWNVTGGGGPYTWANPVNQTGLCAGTYCNTVTDAHGCSVTKCVTLSQPAALGVALNSDFNGQICLGNCMNLTAVPTEVPVTYLWSTGATTASINVCPTFNTVYSVTVTNTAGCTATASKTITLDPCCGFNITYTVNTCGTDYTFTAVKNGIIPSSVFWTLDGIAITGNQNPKAITGITTGTHTICATATFTSNTGGQPTSYQCNKCITFQATQTYCDFTPDFCTTITPTLTGGILNYSGTTPPTAPGVLQTYNWTFSGGSVLNSNLSSGTVNFPTPGVYNVCLTVIRTCGNNVCKKKCCKQIIINTPCTLTANSEFNYLVNYSGTIPTVALSAVNIPTGATFAWTANGAVIGTSASMNYTPTVSGNYQICLTVAKGQACTKTICHTVLLDNKCNVKADFKSQWCKSAPLDINFSPTSTIPSGATVTWDFGDPASGTNNISNVINPTHTFSTAGSYKVCMTVSMGAGCSATTCYKVNVETPICNFKLDPQVQEAPEQIAMELLYQDAFKSDEIEIYPNPTTGEITVSHPSEIKQIDVFDLMGKHLIQFKTEGNSQSVLNLNNFPNGMYFIKIDGYEAKKIVKATE